MLIFGYDPGGRGNNGVALLDASRRDFTASVGTVDHVEDAIEWLGGRLQGRSLDAAGIDTFLSWATGDCGWRPMDRWLRQQYNGARGSVFASNSAAGSMAVQGVAMALRLKSLWPAVRLNEAHPKVLYLAMTNQRYSFSQDMVNWLVDEINPPAGAAIENDHEWDALISAWATYKGLRGEFPRDLMFGQEGLLYPAGTVSYFWPEPPP